jgi:hypothetical protein
MTQASIEAMNTEAHELAEPERVRLAHKAFNDERARRRKAEDDLREQADLMAAVVAAADAQEAAWGRRQASMGWREILAYEQAQRDLLAAVGTMRVYMAANWTEPPAVPALPLVEVSR